MILMGFFSFKNKRDIYRIHVSHTLRNVALSVVSIYIPIFLLNIGYSLTKTITFFIIFQSVGVLFTLLVCPYLIRKYGLVNLLKAYYPIEICFFVLLNFLPNAPFLFWIIAVVGGLATFSYWIPINILFIKHTEVKEMGNDLARFIALPKIFGILGPLLSAALIPFFGFWPVFVVAIVGLFLSYLPLKGIRNSRLTPTFDFNILNAWHKLRERKLLFILEGFHNTLKESEWFWGIFVFLIIGSLEAPGIVGSLNALGVALFILTVGKIANKGSKVLIPIASAGLIVVWAIRLFINTPLPAYLITLFASFITTFFLISYHTMVYRKVKNQEEEEFQILREVPTFFARIIVFCTILLTITNPRLFFILPILAVFMLFAVFLSHKKQLVV